ncbi:MAG: spore germination protein [Clostridia bacterium]|nr:spore germination protein [Clostridia bacterium]
MINNTSNIYDSLDQNIKYLREAYSADINKDIVFRDFVICSKFKACLIFIDGLVDRDLVTNTILKQLMTPLYFSDFDETIEKLIYNSLLPQMQIKKVSSQKEVISSINAGDCAIFIDELNVVFICDVKKWEHRSVSETKSEISLRGPQEGFIEILKNNVALIRKIIRKEDLIVEYIQIGTKYKTECALIYIKDVANSDLIDEIKKRLSAIQAEYISRYWRSRTAY